MTRHLLVISPHTDDAELGAGATIARFHAEGWTIAAAAFSIAEESVRSDNKQILQQEFADAMDVLGITAARVRTHRYPVRRFDEHRQAILDEMIRLRRDFTPSLVLIPASGDVHQDHSVIHSEAVRAFKNVSLWGYEHPWNTYVPLARRFVPVTEEHLSVKMQMLSCYKSQLEMGRPYFDREAVVAQARFNGLRIGVPFAEGFEAIREIYSASHG